MHSTLAGSQPSVIQVAGRALSQGLGAGAPASASRDLGPDIVVLLLVAIFAKSLAPYDPNSITGRRLQSPSAAHHMGTDAAGVMCSAARLSARNCH